MRICGWDLQWDKAKNLPNILIGGPLSQYTELGFSEYSGALFNSSDIRVIGSWSDKILECIWVWIGSGTYPKYSRIQWVLKWQILLPLGFSCSSWGNMKQPVLQILLSNCFMYINLFHKLIAISLCDYLFALRSFSWLLCISNISKHSYPFSHGKVGNRF